MSKTTPETSDLRDRLAEVMQGHDWRAGDGNEYGLTSSHADHRFHAFCSVCEGDTERIADALLPVVAQEIAAAEQRGRAEALREAADEIVRELICCDVFERRESGHHHQICYWAGASRQLVLDRAALAEPAPEEHP